MALAINFSFDDLRSKAQNNCTRNLYELISLTQEIPVCKILNILDKACWCNFNQTINVKICSKSTEKGNIVTTKKREKEKVFSKILYHQLELNVGRSSSQFKKLFKSFYFVEFSKSKRDEFSAYRLINPLDNSQKGILCDLVPPIVTFLWRKSGDN